MIHEVNDAQVAGKTVLVQSNLDVPLQNGRVVDDTRLRASLVTVKELLDKKAKVILCGHIGRPNGEYQASLSTKQLIQPLQELLKQEVHFLADLDPAKAKQLPTNSVAVLENIRMWPGEEAGEEAFAQQLAQLADLFVNDDYIDSHRSGAANTQLPKLLPSYMGRTLHQEWTYVQQAITNPKRPLTAILGGAKKDKIAVVEHVLEQADHILLGGVLANTFLAASGVDVQASKYDPENLEQAKKLLERANNKIHLPTDCVAATSIKNKQAITCYYQDLPPDYQALDLGPHTIRDYKKILLNSKTILWGGPIGVFEQPLFAHASQEVARAVAQADAYSLVAGGDSAAAINQLGLAQSISHVSIGGGATLHLIAGDKLPAIEALKQ